MTSLEIAVNSSPCTQHVDELSWFDCWVKYCIVLFDIPGNRPSMNAIEWNGTKFKKFPGYFAPKSLFFFLILSENYLNYNGYKCNNIFEKWLNLLVMT